MKQEIIGILDRSGSMNGKEADTIGGINAMIAEVKKNKTDDDTICISMKLFDHEEQLKWNSRPIEEVDTFPLDEFIPRGQTALLDALGRTLTFFMEKKLLNPSAYDTCLMYVATDGQENCSKYYSRSKITELIHAAKESYNIDVIYLGANQDAILEANKLGINVDNAINYSEDSSSTEAVYRAVGRVASDQRSHPFGSIRFTGPERQASQTTQHQSPPAICRQTVQQSSLTPQRQVQQSSLTPQRQVSRR
jgi:uncharacterized protein YegL